MVPSRIPCSIFHSSFTLILLFCHFVSLSSIFAPALAAVAAAIPQNTTIDQQALLSFKSLLYDPLGALASWNNESIHYCGWRGVTCGNSKHPLRVTALNLDSFGLAGTLTPYIANLTFLNRIHLPNNQFHGHIPPEVGHLSHLRYFNLSINSLDGEIPATLSKCSRLHTISLWNNTLSGEIPSNLSQCLKLRSLGLRNNRLGGAIPSEFGSHPKLDTLILSSNNFTGSIPALMGSSSSLTYVDLGNNSLTGGIPPFLANSTSLQFLSLSANKLSGGIPPSLGNTSSLSYVDLSLNNLMGSIPTFSTTASPLLYLDLTNNQLSGGIPPSVGNLTKLIYLYLAQNYLEGSIPESLATIPGLQELDLTTNKLSGQIPPSLYNHSLLTYFGVGDNKLSGTLPPNIGLSLPNLQKLIMQSNQLEGPIPYSLFNASGLQVLNLANNSFSGLVPSNLGSLRNLLQLNIGWNQLETRDWSFLSSLSNCSLLERLYLQDNKLEGSLPKSVGNLSTRLEWLMIGRNRISGTVPAEIGNLANLTVLYMDQNIFTGNIPDTIGRLRRLHVLELSGNKFSGPIPSSIGNLTQLNELYMEENELYGIIPASFGSCRNLVILNLSHNALTGTIPKELVSLSSLAQALDLSHNSLSGPIPTEVGKLINLIRLDVSENHLSGPIPPALGACQVLEYLCMEGNFFQGNIPQSFINLRGLAALDLSRNNLSGPIPEFFKSFYYLQYLNLSFNDFQGEVPKGGVFSNSSEISVDGNKKLCGGDPKLQLPPCFVQASKRKLLLKVVIPTSCVSAIVLLCSLAILCRLKKTRVKSAPKSSLKEKYRKVSYTDILKATDGFSSANLVGTGSFGSVYKGKLDFEENAIVVKVFDPSQIGALKSFEAECEALRNIRHRNLVKVITSCSSVDFTGMDFKALVFEYMPNGSLEEWLHPKVHDQYQRKYLNLPQRLNIALDVASALRYLHHDCVMPLVHCDLKPSNVLLDNDMTAHVGDFGLARFLSGSSSTKSKNSTSLMGIKGSIGYVAPEYAMGVQISAQGDVYSYGILLLEMLTGKKPTNEMFKDGLNLHKYVSMAFPEKVMEIMDPHIGEDEGEDATNNTRDENSAKKRKMCIISLIKIGLLCSKESPKKRMKMHDVASEVQAIKKTFSG